jgi:hypothetical protein
MSQCCVATQVAFLPIVAFYRFNIISLVAGEL